VRTPSENNLRSIDARREHSRQTRTFPIRKQAGRPPGLGINRVRGNDLQLVAAVACHGPRQLLALTEKDLEQVKQMVDGPRGKLSTPTRGRSASAPAAWVNKRKMAKHFALEIADQSLGYQRNQAQIDDETLLDGIYVLRTAETQKGDRLSRSCPRLQAAQGQRARVPPDEDAA